MYSKILKSIMLPLADHLMNTSISHYYREIKGMNTQSTVLVNQWQNENLRNLIQHAYNNTEYYKQLFDKHDINPNSIQKKSDLKRIPILTKQMVQENYLELMPKNIHNIAHKQASTGGSTGDPLKYLLSNSSWSFSVANNIVNWERTSYRYGMKHIALGSTSLFVNEKKSIKHYVYYRMKNKIGLNGVNMSDEVCERYVKLIKSKKIKYLYGYASAIYLLARWVFINRVQVRIEACFTTSEVLTESYRNMIVEAFGCDIVNCYGAHDGGVTAFQLNNGYFNVGYNSIITINERDNENVGSALLTDTLNYAMPFINYKLGDEIEMDDNYIDELGYNGQVLEQIHGRTSDIVRLENGSILTGPGFTILFKDMPIEGYSIEKSGYNTLTCRMIKMEGYTDQHEYEIRSCFEKQGGEGSKILLEYVQEFEMTKSGKKRYFINK